MKKLVCSFWLLFSFLLFASYRIDLDWDEFSGECNGFLNGTIGDKTAGVNGVSAESQLENKLRSLGEGNSRTGKQTFLIESEDGYFTFWLKDKFADQDMFADMDLIANAKPVVRIYQNESLIKQIEVHEGKGLACKVFTLDASDGDVEEEIRYFPKSRILLGKALHAITGEPLSGVHVAMRDNINQTSSFTTDESGFFHF